MCLSVFVIEDFLYFYFKYKALDSEAYHIYSISKEIERLNVSAIHSWSRHFQTNIFALVCSPFLIFFVDFSCYLKDSVFLHLFLKHPIASPDHISLCVRTLRATSRTAPTGMTGSRAGRISTGPAGVIFAGYE